MGKHSSPKPSFAKQLIRDLAPGKRPAGRRAANAPSSATSVLATVKQRPVVAAIAVPAAATAAVVGSTVVMGPPESGNVTTEAASTTPEESTTASTPSQKELDAERKKAGEEYLEKVKDDPKYKNKTSKTDLEVKAPPKPKPTVTPWASCTRAWRKSTATPPPPALRACCTGWGFRRIPTARRSTRFPAAGACA